MSEKPPEGNAAVPAPVAADANAQSSALPRKRRRPGHPLKLTPAVQETICKAIRMGNYLVTAARAAGVSIDSLQRWRRLGEEGREPFASFLASVEQAETECETRLVQIMYDAAPQDYRAARDMLRMRFPERYAPNFDRFDGEGVTFNIQINLGPEALKKPAAIPIEATRELPPKDEPRN